MHCMTACENVVNFITFKFNFPLFSLFGFFPLFSMKFYFKKNKKNCKFKNKVIKNVKHSLGEKRNCYI